MNILPFSRFVISGHSMQPQLNQGDNIVTFNWTGKFKKGDVVVAKVKNKLIIKRIQKIENHKYLLKGDNPSDSKDFGWVLFDQIVGKVILTFAF